MYENPSHTLLSGSFSCVCLALECSLNFYPSTDIEELILLSNYTVTEKLLINMTAKAIEILFLFPSNLQNELLDDSLRGNSKEKKRERKSLTRFKIDSDKRGKWIKDFSWWFWKTTELNIFINLINFCLNSEI